MRIVVPVAAAVLTFLALFPFSGVDTDPPECSALLGFAVPCGSGFAAVAGLVAAALVACGIWIGSQKTRRNQ